MRLLVVRRKEKSMDLISLLSTEVATHVCVVVAIAAFLGGLLLGRVLPSRSSSTGKTHASRKQSGDDKVELYVGNLSYDVAEKDLIQVFERFGKVVSARIIKNRFNDKSKGYGFVGMADRSECGAAIKGLDGKDLKGRKLVVNEAKSQPRES